MRHNNLISKLLVLFLSFLGIACERGDLHGSPEASYKILKGEVTDEDRRPIPAARITLDISGQSSSSIAGAEGEYAIRLYGAYVGQKMTMVTKAAGYVSDTLQLQYGNCGVGNWDLGSSEMEVNVTLKKQ